jgi:hypothetical protein
MPRLEALEDRTALSSVSFSPPVNYPVGPIGAGVADSVAVGDFNGDGKPDLAVASGVRISVLLGDGQGAFPTLQTISVGSTVGSVAVGDFNGDGKPDLAVAIIGNNNVTVLLGNGDGSFQATKNYAVGVFPASVVVGDFNGDGKPDLAVANERSNYVSVLLGNGDGAFQTAQNYAVGTFPGSVAVGDFNPDCARDEGMMKTLATSPFGWPDRPAPAGSGRCPASVEAFFIGSSSRAQSGLTGTASLTWP